MGKINRGRLTLSTNVILTASLITRTLMFGYVMLSIYIKVGNDILDTNVMKMMNIPKVFGMPLGSTVQSIVFSLIAVFVLEFVNGIFGLIGAVGKRKPFLILAVLMSSFMIVVYTVYIVLISMIYRKSGDIYNTLKQYADAYDNGSWRYMSEYYRYTVFPAFLSELGCYYIYSWERAICSSVYKEQVRTYLQTYLGIIVTCILCHVGSIIAVEYTYRKLEFKENHSSLSTNKYYLLLTIKHGIGRSFVCCVRNSVSKVVFFSVIVRCSSLIVSLGLLGLGLTLCGDEFISDSSLRHIFYHLRFYRYTFYDILIGLAAAAVVIGIIGAVSSTMSLLGTYRKSYTLLIASCLLSTILVIPKMLVFIIWAVFIEEINDNMKYQLKILQDGYFNDSGRHRITISWNYMIMKLDCCGVYYSSDTFSQDQWFCCKNSHESRLTIYRQYNDAVYNYLHYFGGCGGYRTETCNGKILYKTRMYIGWFLAIVLLLLLLEIVCILLINKEYFKIQYDRDDEGDNKRIKYSKLLSTVIIFRVTATGIKSFFMRHCKRSIPIVVFLVSNGLIMILSVCTLCIAVHIRYDTVFGNGEIEELLGRISITDTNLNKAIENFSTVVSTFSVAAIGNVVYCTAIMVPYKPKKVFILVGVGLWIAMVITHVIEIGLWSKFLTEVNSSVTSHLALDINSYRYSQQPLRYYDGDLSFSWNTLFVKGKCCGVSNEGLSTIFVGTPWHNSYRDPISQIIPVQCCTSQTEAYPYSSAYDISCTKFPQSYHTQGCDTVVEERLKNNFSIPFFVFTSLTVVAEILCIVAIVMGLRRKNDIDIIDKLIIDPDTTKNKESVENQREKEPATTSEVKSSEKIEHKSESDEEDKMNTSKRKKDKKTKKHRSKPKTKDNKGTLNDETVESYDISERRESSSITRNETITDNRNDVMSNNETIIENETENKTEIRSVSKSNLSEGHSAAEDQQTTTNEMDKRKSVDIDGNTNSPNSDESIEQHIIETGTVVKNETSEYVANTSMNATENPQEPRDNGLVPDLDVEELEEL